MSKGHFTSPPRSKGSKVAGLSRIQVQEERKGLMIALLSPWHSAADLLFVFWAWLTSLYICLTAAQSDIGCLTAAVRENVKGLHLSSPKGDMSVFSGLD